MTQLSSAWATVLADDISQPYFAELQAFVAQERESQTVYPPEEDVFNAFAYTPPEEVKVLLLGQDPYHRKGQAHGLCFSVRQGVTRPPSLRNIYKEMETDLGLSPPNHGELTAWAKQGVLMLNAVLTVREGKPNSHKNKGWETFTDAVIRVVNEKSDGVVFVLWGAYAQKKAKDVDETRHAVLKAAHPSPFSADNGFFGSRPFSSANQALERFGKSPIDWRIDDR